VKSIKQSLAIMSGLLSILSFSNSLSANNLNPWWETIRSGTVILFTSIVAAIYQNGFNEVFTCLRENDTTALTYNSVEAEFAKNICITEQTIGMARRLPYLSLIAVVLMYAAGNFWIYSPAVGNAITKFVRAYEMHAEVVENTLDILDGMEKLKRIPGKEKSKAISKLFKQVEELCRAFLPKRIQRSKSAWPPSNAENPDDQPSSDREALVDEEQPQEDDTSSNAESQIERLNPGNKCVFANGYRVRNFLSLIVSFYLIVIAAFCIIEGSEPALIKCQSKYLEHEYKCFAASHEMLLVAGGSFLFVGFSQIIGFGILLFLFREKNDIDLLILFAKKSGENQMLPAFENFYAIVNSDSSEEKNKILGIYILAALFMRNLQFFRFCTTAFNQNIPGLLEQVRHENSFPYYTSNRYNLFKSQLDTLQNGLPKYIKEDEYNESCNNSRREESFFSSSFKKCYDLYEKCQEVY